MRAEMKRGIAHPDEGAAIKSVKHSFDAGIPPSLVARAASVFPTPGKEDGNLNVNLRGAGQLTNIPWRGSGSVEGAENFEHG